MRRKEKSKSILFKHPNPTEELNKNHINSHEMCNTDRLERGRLSRS